MAYDSISVQVKRNKKNIINKQGFYYTILNETLYLWRYKITYPRNQKLPPKTDIKLIYEGNEIETPVQKLISQTSTTYKKNFESKYPVFEIKCNEIFPMKETLSPIIKRRVMSYIQQSIKIDKFLASKTIVFDGVQ